jgi:DNA-binding response OmpR family regulator
MRLLVVEDDKTIAGALRKGLEQEAFAVDVVHDGDEGCATAAAFSYDLLFVDVMLPGKDGLAITRELRDDSIRTPILMLSARDQVQDKVSGLTTGADDYLAKPFSFEELLARIQALLRRPLATNGGTLTARDLSLDVHDPEDVPG